MKGEERKGREREGKDSTDSPRTRVVCDPTHKSKTHKEFGDVGGK